MYNVLSHLPLSVSLSTLEVLTFFRRENIQTALTGSEHCGIIRLLADRTQRYFSIALHARLYADDACYIVIMAGSESSLTPLPHGHKVAATLARRSVCE
jgi:hypothetical protein